MVKTIAAVVGFFGVLVACLFVSARCDLFGSPSALIAGALVLGAAWVASPQAERMAEWLRRALLRADVGKEVAAMTMQKDASQFSRQLRCKERLPSLSDVADLGDPVVTALALEILESVGGYVVITDRTGNVSRLVAAMETVADAMAPRQAVA